MQKVSSINERNIGAHVKLCLDQGPHTLRDVPGWVSGWVSVPGSIIVKNSQVGEIVVSLDPRIG